ncbi:MAG: hypothetical protein NZ839_04055, partial [Endomicrobia bacterium]|nr:hypothetical protein [Endomicrobiia bacterium]
MKNGIMIYILFFIYYDILFSVNITDSSFIGFPQESFVIFNNPASAGGLEKFSFSSGYGMILPGLLSENLYTTAVAVSSSYDKIFFGIGAEKFVLTNIYSENVYVVNLGMKSLNNKLFIGSNLKYFDYHYTYDEY